MSPQPQSGVQATGFRPDPAERGERNLRLLTAPAQGLAPLPAHLSELSSLLEADPVDLARVSQIIRSDPGLATQVVRLSNSLNLESGQGAVNIEEAVVLLGIDRLRMLLWTCHFLENEEVLRHCLRALEPRQRRKLAEALFLHVIQLPESAPGPRVSRRPR